MQVKYTTTWGYEPINVNCWDKAQACEGIMLRDLIGRVLGWKAVGSQNGRGNLSLRSWT